MPSKENETTKKLAIRTVQLISFMFAFFLSVSKFIAPEADVPWYAIIIFFGIGAGADPELLRDWFKR